MSSTAHFRLAADFDASLLARFAEKTFRDTYTQFNTPENIEAHCSKSFGEQIQLAEIQDAGRDNWIVEIDGRFAAFAQLILQAACPSLPDARGIELLRFYVDSSHHGSGLAYRFMDQLVTRAAELRADVLWLGVWEENTRAIAFYKKCAFKHIADKTFTLGDLVQRDLVMSRALRNSGVSE